MNKDQTGRGEDEKRKFAQRQRSGGKQEDDGRGRSDKAADQADKAARSPLGRGGYAGGFGDDVYMVEEHAPVEERKPKTSTKERP